MDRERRVAESGETPLQFMVRYMRYYAGRGDAEVAKGDAADTKLIDAVYALALDAAHKAAGFVHPRLASTEHSCHFDPTKLSDSELDLFIQLLAKSSAGASGSTGRNGQGAEGSETTRH